MKSFQKLFVSCLFSAVAILGINVANAFSISDVPDNYWAENEIVDSVQHNYILLKNNKYYPDSPITRAEFANAVYNVIQRLPLSYGDGFSDVSYQSKYGKSILSLQQLQIISGYPAGDFKPETYLKRSEASSVISNVIRSDFWDKTVLNPFKDKDDVPVWATPSYINNIVNDIYVNYPKQDVLLPNEYLTRAEAAVLMVKLRNAIELYKTSFLPEDTTSYEDENEEEDRYVPVFVGTNTLGEFEYAYDNKVKIYDNKKIILAGNIVPVKAAQRVDSKKVSEGQELVYVSPKDVYSLEGTKLYGQGTKFIGYVDRTQKSYWFKRQHKSYIILNKAILTDGAEIPVAGVLYSTYRGHVVEEKEKNSLKVQRDFNKKYSKRNAAWKFTNKLVPVVKYTDDTKDGLFMLLTGDMIIPASSEL